MSGSGSLGFMVRPTTLLTTPRLDLVPLRVADAEEMVSVLGDLSLYTFIGGAPPTREELADRYLRQVAGSPADRHESWHNWIVRERTSSAAAGFVQATIDDAGRVADIAVVIGLP